jgi:hypothetical protein
MNLLLLILSNHLHDLQPGGGYMCEVECTVWGTLDSRIPGTVRFDPKPRTFRNRLVVVQCEDTLPCV